MPTFTVTCPHPSSTPWRRSQQQSRTPLGTRFTHQMSRGIGVKAMSPGRKPIRLPEVRLVVPSPLAAGPDLHQGISGFQRKTRCLTSLRRLVSIGVEDPFAALSPAIGSGSCRAHASVPCSTGRTLRSPNTPQKRNRAARMSFGSPAIMTNRPPSGTTAWCEIRGFAIPASRQGCPFETPTESSPALLERLR